MFIEFRNTNKKRQRTIEDALWFAKSYLLPRHKIDEIEIESVKDLHADGEDTFLIAEGDSEAEAAENTIKEFKILQEIFGEDKLPIKNITRMDKIVDN